MSKLLVIFGITGQQGTSLANHVLSTPSLSTQFTIRGITRTLNSPAAEEWSKKGVKVVQGDLDDPSSLLAALAGAHTVFGMTNSPFDQSKKMLEIQQGKNLADAAVASKVEHLIWSTTPSAYNVSSQKLKHVAHFDAKAEVADYIAGLPIRFTFYSPGAFMQNFLSPFRPQSVGHDSLAVIQFVNSETKMPLIDVTSDTGKFVGAILQNPEAYSGKTVAAAGGVYSFQETVETMSRVSGKKIAYMQVPEEQWKSHLPEFMQQEMAEMMMLFQDYGYYGGETEDVVERGRQDVEGVTSFESFVTENLSALGLA